MLFASIVCQRLYQRLAYFLSFFMRGFTCLVLCFFLVGCASTQQVVHENYAKNDPMESSNRDILKFNMKVEMFFAPVVILYSDVVPKFVQARVTDFFHNLYEPMNFALDLIQMRKKAAGDAAGRFLTNSTIGLFGLFDFATPAGVPYKTTTIGETLAVYGVPSGPYMVFPLSGPTTLRGLLGGSVATVVDPLSIYAITERLGYHRFYQKAPYYALYGVNALGPYMGAYRSMSTSSLDFYSSLRDIYNQSITKKIRSILQDQGRLPHDNVKKKADDISNFFQ